MTGMRVEQLAQEAGVSVATIRYYQSRGLVAPPRREGRVAWYDPHHLQRLTAIRDLAARGFSLAQVSRLLDDDGAPDPLHDALLSSRPAATLDRDGLAERSGVARPVVDLLVGAGLLSPVTGGDDERFDDGAVAMLDAAAAVGRIGLPVDRLLALAVRHEHHVRQLVDDAVRLVHDHASAAGTSREDLAEVIEGLVPAAARLVGDHFRRALLDRAMLEVRADDRLAVRIVELGTGEATSSDGLALFHHAAAPDTWRVLWHHPERDVTLAATGTAAILDATASTAAILDATASTAAILDATGGDPAVEVDAGLARFAHAAGALDELAGRLDLDAPDGAPAPTLIGGFAFSPRSAGPADPRWAPLGEGALILPAICVLQRGGRTWLQLATAAGGHDTLDELARTAADLLRPQPAPSASEVPDLSPCADPTADPRYEQLVADALSEIRTGRIAKLVLARAVELTGSVDVTTVLDRLRRANPNCVTFAFGYGATCFLGATPELLVDSRDGTVSTTAVAGTRPRRPEPAADAAEVEALRTSAKDRAEHQFVIDQLTASMAEAGATVTPVGPTEVVSFAAVHHLVTPLQGEARVGPGDLVRLVGHLHPSPAVGGTPTRPATAWLAEHEGLDRGWYAAPIGVVDLDGNGEFWVALRSALTHDDGVVAFVGAGVVEGSVPADELHETTAKFATIARALGLADTGLADTGLADTGLADRGVG